MIYAIRRDGLVQTLIELPNKEHLGEKTMVSSKDARAWVLAGRLHETGLWIDSSHRGRRVKRTVRYAEPLES